MESYHGRIKQYQSFLRTRRMDKHTLINDALDGCVNLNIINEYCQNMNNRTKDCDFQYIVLIRLLFLLDHNRCSKERNNQTDQIDQIDHVNQNDSTIDPLNRLSSNDDGIDNHPSNIEGMDKVIDMIVTSFSSYPFWPNHKNSANYNWEGMDNTIFWTENHIFMGLSSAYLFKQYVKAKNLKITHKISEREENLLLIYLNAHTRFQGFYECNSHVYLPYTLSALFNLYDYASNPVIKEQSNELISILMKHTLLCTSHNSIISLSISSRALPRQRQRVVDHNMNQLVRILTGSSPDPYNTTAIANFITSTTWQPNIEYNAQWYEFEGFISLRSSHSKYEIRELYESYVSNDDITFDSTTTSNTNHYNLDKIELVPFYWSAGLITDPMFISDTKRYQKLYGLDKNIHIYPLSYLYPTLIESLVTSYAHLSEGQSYTNLYMNVYKQSGGVVLSSFEMFNCNRVSYQQLPWIVNLNGVGIWSQSGEGSEGISGFAITNTHNPYIKQRNNVAVIAYSAPPALETMIIGSLLSRKVRLFWPSSFMDVHDDLGLDHGEWWYGKRGICYIGVLCTKETVLDVRKSRDCEVTYDGRTEHIPKRVCKKKNHSWIVVVGTCKDYPEMIDFKSHCSKIEYEEYPKPTKGRFYGESIPSHSNYSIRVTVPGFDESIVINCNNAYFHPHPDNHSH